MDLKEFTTQTLIQIVEGTAEANQKLNQIDSFIPDRNLNFVNTQCARDENGISRIVIPVDFDVAITTTESDGKSGGAGIKVVAFNFGGNVESKVESQTISRIKYTIPLVLKKNE